MSDKKLLLKLADDLAVLVDDLREAAEGMPEKQEEHVGDTPEKESVADAPVEQEKNTAETPEKGYEMEDIRKKLAVLSSDGKTTEIRELLGRYGARRLSEVKPEDYAAVMKEAEAL